MDLTSIHSELSEARQSSVRVAERLARLEAQIGRIEKVDVDVDRALTSINALEARMNAADLRDTELVQHLTTAKEALVRVEQRLDHHTAALSEPPDPRDGMAKMVGWFLDTRAGVALLVLVLSSVGLFRVDSNTAELARQVSEIADALHQEDAAAVKKGESNGGVMPTAAKAP